MILAWEDQCTKNLRSGCNGSGVRVGFEGEYGMRYMTALAEPSNAHWVFDRYFRAVRKMEKVGLSYVNCLS